MLAYVQTAALIQAVLSYQSAAVGRIKACRRILANSRANSRRLNSAPRAFSGTGLSNFHRRRLTGPAQRLVAPAVDRF